MAFETLNLGINLTLPTTGTKNWGLTLKNTTWTQISQHDHTGSGKGLQLPAGAHSPNTIATGDLSKNIGVTQAATLTPSGTTETLDFDNGNVQVLDLGSATGDVTLTLSNPAQGHTYLVFIIQSATARALTWPANVKWPQGQAILLSAAEDAKDYVKMYYDGTDFNVLAWDLDIS